MRRLNMSACGAAVLAAAVGLAAIGHPSKAQIAVRNQGYVPYSEAPINYRSENLSDPVALLQKRLDMGEARLVYDDKRGYLKSVLDLLKVPVESQTLVFSKTSFQYLKIEPDHPRALYYNDDVYVGSVHDGKAVEIVSFDPMQGAIFYLLDEKKADRPVFQRAELDCTQCHIAAGTRGVPGVFLRSVYPTANGSLQDGATSFITDQKSPLKQRWGGWFASGSLAKDTIGNAVAVETAKVADQVPPANPQVTPLAPAYDASAYLTKGSDQVALLVLAHQTQMHNLITLTNYQTRLALYALQQKSDPSPTNVSLKTDAPALEALPEDTRQKIEKPAEQLLRYLLFSNETPLGGLDAKQAIASSPYAREFAAQGVRDTQKRSLRDFDLHDRIFRYSCSYLIYSSAFDAIPDPARGYIYHRLLQVLTGQDQSPDFANLSAPDRQAILSILLETKSNLPAEWRDYARSNHLRLAASQPIPGRGAQILSQ